MKNLLFSLILFYSYSFVIAQNESEYQIKLTNCTDFCLFQDNNRLLTANNTSIYIYSVKNKVKELEFNSRHKADISSITISNDEKYILSGDKNGEIQLYSIEGEFIRAFQLHSSTIYDLDFHPTRSMFISSSGDGQLVLKNFLNDDPSFILTKSKKPVFCSAFNSDGQYIYTGLSNGTILIFNSENHNLIKSKKLHRGVVRDIEVSQKDIAYTAGDDMKIRTFNFNSDRINTIKTEFRIKDWILSLDIGDGEYMAFCDYSGQIFVKISSLVYQHKGLSPIIKMESFTNADKQIELVFLTYKKGISFVSTSKMEIWEREGEHNRKTQLR